MHNQLYSAGRQSSIDGRPCEPRSDPAVRGYTAALAVGDQFASAIEDDFIAGFDDARATCSGETPKEAGD